MRKITFRLEHIKAGIPTTNGRLYSEEVLREMVRDVNQKSVLIRDEIDSPTDQTITGDPIGYVKNATFDGECVVIDAAFSEGVSIPEALDISAQGAARWEGKKTIVENAKLEYFRAVDPSVLEIQESKPKENEK